MKRKMIILAIFLLMPLSNASGTSITLDFLGNFTFSDEVGGDTFRESLTFHNPFGSNSGVITFFEPAGDAAFSDAGFETIWLTSLHLDPTNYVSGSYFAFSPGLYGGGFRIFDDDLSELLVADLLVDRLEVSGSSGDINSMFMMNLVGISAGSGYVAGSSAIIDAFLAAPGGAANFTLQSSGDFSKKIINQGGPDGSAFTGSYSGSAAPSPVPEPVSLFLVGAGLLGMGAVARGARSQRRT